MADKKRVRTTGFVTRFEVEKGLTVTAEGVELTADQVARVQRAAKLTRTKIVVEDVKDAEEAAPDNAETTDADTAATSTPAAGTRAKGGRS